jgi:hypothetical protein
MGAAPASSEPLAHGAHAWKRPRLASARSRQANEALLTWDSSASDVCFQLLHVQVSSSYFPPPQDHAPPPRKMHQHARELGYGGRCGGGRCGVVVPVPVRAVKMV